MENIPLKVLVVDTDFVFANGLSCILKTIYPSFEIHVIKSDDNIIECLNFFSPDIIFMEYCPTINSCLEKIQILRGIYPNSKVYICYYTLNAESIKKLLLNEVSGIMSKRIENEFELKILIENSMKSKYNYCSITARILLDAYFNENRINEKQKHIIKGISAGKTNIEISNTLNISLSTFENLKRKLMTDFNLTSNAEIIKFSIKNGYTSLD